MGPFLVYWFARGDVMTWSEPHTQMWCLINWKPIASLFQPSLKEKKKKSIRFYYLCFKSLMRLINITNLKSLIYIFIQMYGMFQDERSQKQHATQIKIQIKTPPKQENVRTSLAYTVAH